MRFHIVIPARFNSSRLPGKPLLDLNGRPMIWHVYQRAIESKLGDVIVATDDERIHNVVKGFGGDSVLTSKDHQSGTDRLAEVSFSRSFNERDVVLNLQGDEPLIPAACIRKLADLFLKYKDVDVSTLSCPIKKKDDLVDPNVVKVITGINQKALYFSRAPIPFDRSRRQDMALNAFKDDIYQRHIGIYAYRVDKLRILSELPQSPLEKLESLEQLRALENDLSIFVEKLDFQPPHGVDTMADYEKIKIILEKNNGTHLPR